MTHHKQSEALQMRERAYAICNDQKLPLDTRQLAFVLAGGFTSLHNHITSLESQFAAIGAGGVEPLRRRECLHQIAEPAAMVAEVENMRKALQFYADGDHFIRSDQDAWDTVSGEPPNYWCDEAGTATVEDGSIAKLALSGHVVRFEDEDAIAPSEQAPAQAAPAAVAGPVDAWMTPEGDRVVTEATMAGARKDGGAMLSSMRPYTVALVRAANAAPVAQGDALDAAFEAVRKRLCELQRYSFVLDDDGVVRRVQDRVGNWIEFDDAHALFDPVAVDAARAQAKEGASND